MQVAARFCEGGHICTLPRECCTQGCCPPYQSGPRQLPPPSEHMLNLFFISHWFFWCVVVAIILSVLCAYSLWKKRRTLCGWGFTEHHVQSEGDSAGSCYAPPQYSRCNSFHHPPPPYTEVTSKPDLYPLVFTCNSENGKNGSSYLMVQYFRNYIVRPAGSLSAASTVDSLSSSFICNVNEANTLVPPPYSRAASPEIGFSSHFQQHYMMPRSASQLVCMNGSMQPELGTAANLSTQQVYQQQQPARNSLYTAVALNAAMGNGQVASYDTQLLPATAESDNYHNDSRERDQRTSSFIQAHCGQHVRNMGTSNSSISDIFVNSAVSVGNELLPTTSGDTTSLPSTAIYSNGCIQTNPLHHVSTRSVPSAHSPVCNSRRSLTGVAGGLETPRHDMQLMRRSLESCRQLLQHQPRPAAIFHSMDAPERLLELAQHQNSGSDSMTSSLLNVEAPVSTPTGANSPTGEVQEMLEQIRQLQTEEGFENLMGLTRPVLQHTLSSPTPAAASQVTKRPSTAEHNLQRCTTMPEGRKPSPTHTPTHAHAQSSINLARSKRPVTLQHVQSTQCTQSKKKYLTPKPNKAMYIPMVASNAALTNRCILKSPVSSVVGASIFTNRGRVRKVWLSRSAPTTPGTCLPPNRLGDDSPLLNDHEEDQEGEQCAEMELV